MRILFSALHLAYFRNFESVVREMARRGHQVHLSGDEPEEMGGRALAERLSAEHGGVTWDLAPPVEDEPWFEAARRLRLGLDYARVLDRRYAGMPKLRIRALERTPRAVRWMTRVPVAGAPAATAALKQIERWMPQSPQIEAYLRRHRPDVLVLASLTYARSYQLDLLKAARALRIPVAAAIMSWDHLSSKALLHLHPDMVLVWNDVQRQEAIGMHGVAAERIVVTGAQCYDQWFERRPDRSYEAFASQMGLRADRPFVLYVCSALSPTPQPPEPVLVRRWIEALRRSGDPSLQELGVLVRPHPERVKEWGGDTLEDLPNVAFHGRNPIDAGAKSDYFDSLHHSSAVVGLVTSAFLEAAIAGKPVLTFTLPEYRLHQEGMAHFQYLTTVAGGLLRTAPDLGAHLDQLRQALALGGARDERNRRFLEAFVRPAGLDAPATPAFVDALERLQQEGTLGDPSLRVSAPMQRLVAGLAARGRSGLARWLLIDPREDVWDSQRLQKQQNREARAAGQAERRAEKLRRRNRRIRRDAWMRRGKQVKSALSGAARCRARGRTEFAERTGRTDSQEKRSNGGPTEESGAGRGESTGRRYATSWSQRRR
jgi:hypothetical protein